MARINFETKVWQDSRFQRLLIETGDRHRAIGMVIDLWTLAQRHWCPDRRLIPVADWDSHQMPEVLLTCGLAERRGDGIYAKGSEERFQWWFDGIEQRSAAGKKSAQRPRDVHGRLLPAVSNGVQRALVQSPTNTNEIQPSSSSSSSKEEIHIVQRKRRTVKVESSFDLESAYDLYPRKQGKTKGLERLSRQIRTEDDYQAFLAAIEHYKRSPDVLRGYVKVFTTFVSEWRDWIDPDTGSMNRPETTPRTEMEF